MEEMIEMMGDGPLRMDPGIRWKCRWCNTVYSNEHPETCQCCHRRDMFEIMDINIDSRTFLER